jgi:DNA-binding MarR family transcriptional regulator
VTLSVIFHENSSSKELLSNGTKIPFVSDSTDQLMDKAADRLLALMSVYHKNLFRINKRISGLEAAQYRVLGVLMKQGPQSISDIGRTLFISKPYMTVLIDSLMEKGWIERHSDPNDRRVVRITMTQGGEKHLRRVFEIYKADIKILFASLERDDISQLCSSLEHLQEIIKKLE